MPVNFKLSTVISPKDIDKEIKIEQRNLNIVADKLSAVENSQETFKTNFDNNKKNLLTKRLLFKSLQDVSAKHGEDAPVRLKNDHFKYGKASNFFKKMFHDTRYQTEREAAVNKINCEGSLVSAIEAIKHVEKEIISIDEEINEILKNDNSAQKEFNKLKEKKSAIQSKIDKLVESKTAKENAIKKLNYDFEIFSIIYHTNVGSNALNYSSLNKYTNAEFQVRINPDKVLAEHERAKGGKGGKAFVSVNEKYVHGIKANFSNRDEVDELVTKFAHVLYTPKGNEKDILSFRGQLMSDQGIQSLLKKFKDAPKTVYFPGQFFSTSTDKEVAMSFLGSANSNNKVLFRVEGNSGNGLSLPGGLSFDNNEKEKLYSPLAHFQIKGITQSQPGHYIVDLKEIARQNEAEVLPYK